MLIANLFFFHLAGALVVTGGIGVSGAINGGAYILTSGTISTTNATASTTHTNGALVVTGGVGIGQDINVAGSYTGGSGGIFTTGPIRTTSTTASTSTTTGALRSGGGLGVVGSANIGGDLTVSGRIINTWDTLYENSDLTTTLSYSIPTTFKVLRVLVRSYSVSTSAAQVRVAMRTGTTAATHSGVSFGNNGWNVAYMNLASPSAADSLVATLHIHNTGFISPTYTYVVDGVTMTTASTTAAANCGSITTTIGALDNMLFSVSTGTIDAGRVSIYASY